MLDGEKMTTDFNANNDCESRLGQDIKSSKEIDILQRDRSELLSAYLDGEVTASERQQVQQWLETDAKMQCLYRRLLKLRQGLQTLPIPHRNDTPEQTVSQVFAKIRNRQRVRTVVTSGAGAIAAMFVAALSGIMPGNQTLTPQMAQYKSPAQPSTLMVALNHPVIEIPKAAVAAPEKLLDDQVEKTNQP